MKITKKKLQELIKEELRRALKEGTTIKGAHEPENVHFEATITTNHSGDGNYRAVLEVSRDEGMYGAQVEAIGENRSSAIANVLRVLAADQKLDVFFGAK